MKLLLVHNHYRQSGGEDQVFADECALLEAHGDEVVRYTVHNDSLTEMGPLEMARRALWNSHTYRELRALIRRERPALMHCANIFPLISPSAYYAAHSEGIPVVQTLHNYRLLCPNALFLRDGAVCERCLGRSVPWPAIQHGCYRDSRSASAVVAGLMTMHRAIGTWTNKVDCYIALTEFARRKFIEGGLPDQRLVVKPNFISQDTGPGPGRGGYAVFVGRLSAEKGVTTLLDVWTQFSPSMPLKIVGDGPLAEQVREAAATRANIEWLGHRPSDEVQTIIGNAACLLLPSVCYEGFPKTIVEAFSQGTPVVASRIGVMAELIEPGRTGWLVEANDSAALAHAVGELNSSPERLQAIRGTTRDTFEAHYTAEANYQQLSEIYGNVLQSRERREKDLEDCRVAQSGRL